MRRTAVPVLLLLTALTTSACGGDEPEAGSTPDPTSGAPSEPPAGTPSTTPPTRQPPSTPPAVGGIEEAIADVQAIAPALESFYRGAPYPQTLEEAIASLDDAGLSLMRGNTLETYVYDPESVEFAICIQTGSGAWATYDTSPMSVRESGESGGCPGG